MKILLSSLIVLLSMDCFAQFRHAEYVSPCVEHSAGEVAVGIKLASESDIVQWSASVMCASDGNAHVNLKGGFYVARVKGYRLLMCPFYLHGIVVPQKGFRYNTPTSLQVDKLYRDITVAVGADFFYSSKNEDGSNLGASLNVNVSFPLIGKRLPISGQKKKKK